MAEDQSVPTTEDTEPTEAERIEALEKDVKVLIELVEKLSARVDKIDAKHKSFTKRLDGVPSSVFTS